MAKEPAEKPDHWRELEDLLIRMLPQYAEQISLLLDDPKFRAMMHSCAVQCLNLEQTRRVVENTLILRGMV